MPANVRGTNRLFLVSYITARFSFRFKASGDERFSPRFGDLNPEGRVCLTNDSI